MEVICYSSLKSAVVTNEKFFEEKTNYAQF